MVRTAIAFFILAIIAFVFGLYGVAGLSMQIGRVLLFVFLILAVLSYFGGAISGRRRPK